MFYKKLKRIIFCISIRDISKVSNTNKVIYQDEFKLYKYESYIYETYIQQLHDIDKFSTIFT